MFQNLFESFAMFWITIWRWYLKLFVDDRSWNTVIYDETKTSSLLRFFSLFSPLSVSLSWQKTDLDDKMLKRDKTSPRLGLKTVTHQQSVDKWRKRETENVRKADFVNLFLVLTQKKKSRLKSNWAKRATIRLMDVHCVMFIFFFKIIQAAKLRKVGQYVQQQRSLFTSLTFDPFFFAAASSANHATTHSTVAHLCVMNPLSSSGFWHSSSKLWSSNYRGKEGLEFLSLTEKGEKRGRIS